ncbi:MAG: hypothetical protein WC500_05040 [Candidatus Margulisiibacteriota bacterium]
MFRIGERIGRFIYRPEQKHRPTAKQLVFCFAFPLEYENLFGRELRAAILNVLQQKVKQLPELIVIDSLIELKTHTMFYDPRTFSLGKSKAARDKREKMIQNHLNGVVQWIKIAGFNYHSSPNDAYRADSRFLFNPPFIFSMGETYLNALPCQAPVEKSKS